MFPESSGLYIAQRDQDLYVVKVKGVYPTLQLDKKIMDLGEFLRRGKIQEAPREAGDNIELFHESWRFYPLAFLYGIFSNKLEFAIGQKDLYLSDEDYFALRGRYYRLIQQGVPSTKAVRAISYEFKLPTERVCKLINGFEKEAPYVD